MDIRELEQYPVCADFPFDDGRVLELTADANHFTPANVRRLERAIIAARREAIKPAAEKLEAVKSEIAALAEKYKGKKKTSGADAARMAELNDLIDAAKDEAESCADDAEREVYAAEMVRVLVSWGATDEQGEPAPLTVEVMRARPLMLLRDLYRHCREAALPKVERDQKKARMSETTTTQALSGIM